MQAEAEKSTDGRDIFVSLADLRCLKFADAADRAGMSEVISVAEELKEKYPFLTKPFTTPMLRLVD
jgi:hypothetical protein